MGRVGEPELTIVIPTIDMLSKRVRVCVETVRAHTNVDHEVIVVDNHTPHQGYTAPANAGIRAAQGRYVVLMNDDVEVQPGWWSPLRECLDGGAYAAVPEGATPSLDLLNFAGSCLALSRNAIDRVGYSQRDFFDPQFKVWFQDIDLFLELCRLGSPPLLAKGSRVVHRRATTIRTPEDFALRDWVKEQIDKDREAFVRKWPGGRRGAAAQQLIQNLRGNASGSESD